jgi:hypothetical protein
MGKDASVQNLHDHEGETLEKPQEKQQQVVDGPRKAKSARKRGTRRRKSAKQVELDAMPIVPPLVLETALLHDIRPPHTVESDTKNIMPSPVEEALYQQAKVLGLPGTLEPQPPVRTETHVQEGSAQMDTFLHEAALHQRAKALGLSDTLEPHTPASGAQEDSTSTEAEVKQPTQSLLQEAALHQRARVRGLPDECLHTRSPNIPSLAPQEPLEGREALPALPEQDHEEIKRQEAIANEDQLVALDSEVVTLHVVHAKADTLLGKAQVFKARIVERRNSLEESAHNARLKVDAALEAKFGDQAEKIQTEIEKARLSAISDTARIAERLHEQLGRCALDLRTQQQEMMITADPLLNQNDATVSQERDPIVVAPTGDNIVAQRVLEAHQGLEETAHLVREKIDHALEKKFGNQAEQILSETEKAREAAIDETARAAEKLEETFGKCAASFREQLQTGITPAYH